ncbi:anti-sigma factor family protein [Pengzhenrongella frigida]|uniref:Zf-HC2 domain-containing protein n=1 Tax=Pengzhenrongella frigida TaxID=1259133 RepID=A0A4Q5N1N3_9MICO|nr:zf-HC2 domain-containing protein [Cellulomonas sp. HLT2-17]RYV51999.1 zf-HC2 domain-containing protein [Cellulomonas sp. HLT2-17]
MTQHLGTWVSALVDGQLGPAATERALAHVAACPECAHELAAARQARRVLSVVHDVAPAPDLTARLLALGSCPPMGQGAGPARPGERKQVVPLGLSAYSLPARALSGDLTARRRPSYRVAVGSLASVGVAVIGLFLIGDQPPVVPTAHPAEVLSILGHARGPGETVSGTLAPDLAAQVSTAAAGVGGSGLTEADVLAWMRDAGWACPTGVPGGYEITAARLTGDTDELLELDLAGPDGPIVVTEERGVLDAVALTGTPTEAIGDRTVYVINRQPWHVVWQSGDTVVSVVSEASTDSVAELVADFPAAGFDDGLPARITRGWDTVTGAFARP